MTTTALVQHARRRLGPVGVWLPPAILLATPVNIQRQQFARIEAAGYGSLWSGEPPATSPSGTREAFAQHSLMLAATRQLLVGTGVANLQMRHALAMRSGAATLAEGYPGRFVLGVGGQGQAGTRPLTTLRDYLEAMDAAPDGHPGEAGYPRVLAALGPRMLALAAERADGAHPFLQPVAHTAVARQALGPDKLLIPHQAVMLDTDATRARGSLRALFGGVRRGLPSPYVNNWRRLGYGEDDLAGDRSDRLIDALLAWGEETAIARRVHEHLEAGADHVLVQPLAGDLPAIADQLQRLAPALRNLARAGA